MLDIMITSGNALQTEGKKELKGLIERRKKTLAILISSLSMFREENKAFNFSSNNSVSRANEIFVTLMGEFVRTDRELCATLNKDFTGFLHKF